MEIQSLLLFLAGIVVLILLSGKRAVVTQSSDAPAKTSKPVAGAVGQATPAGEPPQEAGRTGASAQQRPVASTASAAVDHPKAPTPVTTSSAPPRPGCLPITAPDGVVIDDVAASMIEAVRTRGESAFVTGKAGTGKSTMLRLVRDALGSASVVLAPTGVAALNVQGQTISSFFGFPPRYIDRTKVSLPRSREALRRVRTIIVDEVSMVRADVIEGMDSVLRQAQQRDLPFGGVQMLFFGDPFQLPPVVDDPELLRAFSTNFGGAYFFNAPSYTALSPTKFELQRIHRQSDPTFIRVLNDIRLGAATSETFFILNSRLAPEGSAQEQTLTLTSTNGQADAVNSRRMDALRTVPTEYVARVTDTFDEAIFPTARILALKPGARVMFLRNDRQKRWVNGTVGTVLECRARDVSVQVGPSVFTVGAETWENVRYKFSPQSGKVEPTVVGTFIQIPLRIAYAVTIHKSQGLTLERARIDLGKGAFAHGQLYVALSRCRSLEGLELTQPVTARDVIVDSVVAAFDRGGTAPVRRVFFQERAT